MHYHLLGQRYVVHLFTNQNMRRALNHHCHKKWQHNNNKNIKGTSTIETTYKPVHLHIICQGKNLLLMNEKVNQIWDYHVPPDHRLAELNISSANHPRAIFQAYVGLKPKEPTRASQG